VSDYSTTFSRKEWDMRKTAEECSELATALFQQLNKPHKNLTPEIVDEIGDVLFRIERLKEHYDCDALAKRIVHKITKEKEKEEKRTKNARSF